MQTETLSLDTTDCFPQCFVDYINRKKELASFYNTFPTIENFRKIIKQRQFSDKLRATLSYTLKEQYRELETTDLVTNNIEKLKNSKTFTITTGHQLNIFTGPLYFIYKIITVIDACKTLKKKYPEYDFVPVYWMASEDHDVEEISHFRFQDRKIEWQTKQKGAIGRFDPAQLKEIAKTLPDGATFFEQAYAQETLAEAVCHYVNHLFGTEGLVVINPDTPSLKKVLIPIIEDDLFMHHAEKLVSTTSASLKELGYKNQVHARQINFFYLNENVRERIEKNAQGFRVVGTDLHFSESEMKLLIQTNPERFSPNVILRPLYQEIILPNLAYVGGPSEVIYWLQLKSVFDRFQISFPLLMPRNFAVMIDQNSSRTWRKTELSTSDLFLNEDKIFTKWVTKNADYQLSYADEVEELKEIEKRLKKKAEKIDPSLFQHLQAIHSSFLKKVKKAEKKLLKAEKQKYEAKKHQIKSVKDALFPEGTLQERKDNFLNFYLRDPQFIQKLIHTFDAFNYRMYLLFE